MKAGLLLAASVAAIAFVPAAAGAEDFPVRPVRLLVPFAPGGNTDILARAVGPKLTEKWGKPVVVDNRPGGAGIIACETVARATPDGHTLLVASTGEVAVNPSLFKNLPYDVARDFAPITLGTVSPLLLVRHPSLAVRNVKELIEAAKAKPRAVAYASVGIGSPMHLSGELFKMVTHTDLVHVPYKGGAPATAALLGGQEAQTGFVGMGPVLPHVKAGRLHALAISTAKRSPLLPQVPTFRELGYPEVETHAWFGFFLPAGSPKEAVSRIHLDVKRVLDEPDFRQKQLIDKGYEVVGSAPDEFAAYIRKDSESRARAVKISGAKAE